MESTNQAYHRIVTGARDLFVKKSIDYGPAWQILRIPSLTDQILIKAERIRSVQETGINKVGDSIEGEFVGILNYCIIALMLLEMPSISTKEQQSRLQDATKLTNWYDQKATWAFEVMEQKNHDYGEAWRKMRVSSITDLILMKIFRLKKIEDNEGKLLVSEGVEANYIDMLNYAVFALIRLEETGGK
ncbi:MAG: DUF1599 domain-containing protein [Bacteroidia bacterium]|nr:DUF1599 domain-containing protein [Bacteroidia bacterium]